MKYAVNRQLRFGQLPPEDIYLNLDSNDHVMRTMMGLMLVRKDQEAMERVIALLRSEQRSRVGYRLGGRPGMDRWTALTLGLIKQNMRCDFDTLVMLANSHNELRQFLGHSDIRDKALYARRTVIDNVNKFTPELLDAINVEIVKCGHKLQGKTPETPLIARADSFVVENNARWPTDMSLLRDAVRAGVNLGAKELQKAGLPGWQKSESDTASVKAAFNLVRKVGSASEEDVKAYLEICKPFVAWMEKTAAALASRGSDLEPIKIKPNKIPMLEHFIRCARILLDQIRRRVVEGETIPHREKFFSVFEFYTRWISKGKAGCIAELGAPATVAQDRHGFVLASMVNWTGGDTECAVPIVVEARKRFLLEAMSFDRGFAARRTGPSSTRCSISTRFRRKAA